MSLLRRPCGKLCSINYCVGLRSLVGTEAARLFDAWTLGSGGLQRALARSLSTSLRRGKPASSGSTRCRGGKASA